MDPVTRCEELVARLRAQVDAVLPAASGPYGYSPERLPPERLPAIADLVADVLRAEVLLLDVRVRAADLEAAERALTAAEQRNRGD